jgi:hypothetical protein
MANPSKAPRSDARPSSLLEALRAPIDDEPYTDEEREAVRKAREDVRAGRVMSTDELRRRLGL